jgi:periplasmic divalent cation tolerance protein
MSEIRLVLCTFPDAVTARQIGTLAVENQVAACVNLVPGVESIYRWEGKVECATEVLGIFKTTAATWPMLAEWLREKHPYDTPEIMAIDPTEVDARYHDWVLNNVAPPDR